VGGFDERFHMYSEDDDFSMRVREAKYRIVYTPHASGIHDESATSKQTGMQMEWIKASNAIMEEKWGWFFSLNRDNHMGTFI
jgi:GT2 family glycosyltransferase